MKKINYNKIPYFVCKKCLSPNIRCEDAKEPAIEGRVSDEYRYCADCGCVETVIMSPMNWENKYEEMHGLSYLENN